MLALKSFKDLITFSTWNGLITARQKAGPLGPARTLPKQLVTRRMRQVNIVKQQFTQRLIDQYKNWANGSAYTWKDQYTGRTLAAAYALGQFPMIATDVIATEAAGVVTYTYTLSNYFIIEGTGWGHLAWGESPWGHSSAFLAPDGAPLTTDYKIQYLHPLAEPVPKSAVK